MIWTLEKDFATCNDLSVGVLIKLEGFYQDVSCIWKMLISNRGTL